MSGIENIDAFKNDEESFYRDNDWYKCRRNRYC